MGRVEPQSYRASDAERRRAADLTSQFPKGIRALDVGARDGFFSRVLADHFDTVVALDIQEPNFSASRVDSVKGNVADLDFEDRTFDFVLCAEVLEHIPPHQLASACAELTRVTRGYLLIGVPYRQDTRVGRTTCLTCGEKNPPWGHVNSFDEKKLTGLFSSMEVTKISYVGEGARNTNFLSTWLFDRAGNPYGSYDQEEACVFCSNSLIAPSERSFVQKVLTRTALLLDGVQGLVEPRHASWIHILFRAQEC